MNGKSILLATLMILVPAVPMAAGGPSFENGQAEAIADLAAPGFGSTVKLMVPAGYYVTNATMKVTGMAAKGNSSAYPENVQVLLNDTLLWGFQKAGFGPMGTQNIFSTGQRNSILKFGPDGGLIGFAIRLPKEAVVQKATMDIRGISPSRGQEQLNLTGAAAGDSFSHWTANAGDVNKDGYPDLIVGAYFNDAGGANAGQAYIYLGGPDLDGVADLTLTGAAAGDNFGQVVSTAGDVNKDGYDDVIVGAPLNDDGGSEAGSAYIFLGGQNMDSVADVTLTGLAAGDNFGWYVSNAGDVNKDGYDDVIVGAQLNDTAGADAGRAYLFFGGQNMDRTADVTFTGAAAGDYFGVSVSTAGDVNKDGYDDVAIGAWHNDSAGSDSGSAYLYFGGQSMDNMPDLEFSGAAAGALFGWPVVCAGDLNNDSYDDLAIGAESTDNGNVYVYFGGKNMDNKADVTFTGSGAGDQFGNSISNAGDWNDDGFTDILVGAIDNDAGGANAGSAYIYFGGPDLDSVADVTFTGAAADDYFGDACAGLGDMNHDGFVEVIIGADGNDAGGSGAGRAYDYSRNLTLSGILDVSLMINKTKIWDRPGYFNGTASSGDFAPAINDYLRSAAGNNTDEFGNSFVDVLFSAYAKNGGTLNISNLTIVYSYNATIPDFTPTLNRYVKAHSAEKDANGNISVPFVVRSSSAGRVKLFGLDTGSDLPPVLVKDIMATEMDEDTAQVTLIDLYPYFEDDNDPDTNLTFSIVSSANESYVRLWITARRYLSADSMTGEANDNWTGSVDVIVACMDRWGHRSESNQFTIAIKNVNDPPVITSKPPTTATIGIPYSYLVTAVDVDRDVLKYSLLKAPASMAIDASNGTVSWVPSTAGVFPVALAVGDGQENATQDFNITVPRLPNRSPRVTNTSVPEAVVGKPYRYAIQAEDEDADRLSFTLRSGEEKMALDANAGVLSWTPKKEGAYPVSVEISDGHANLTYNFTVIAKDYNRAPVFNTAPVGEVVLGMFYSYDSKAVDLDTDVLTYSIVSGPQGMTIVGSTGKVGWNPTGVGNFTVKLKVSDGKGGEATQEYTLKVVDKARAKVEFTAPSEGQLLKGRFTVTGKAVKGTLDIMKVQIRINSGEWMDVSGKSNWSFDLDTNIFKNGKHLLEARAFDGTDYSDIVGCQFTVDNQKAQAKGFIPMVDGWMLPLLLAVIGLVFSFKRGCGAKN
jgi:hypothetical protein